MKQIICKDCGKSFSILPKEEKFYTSKGLQIPKRCKKCRNIRIACDYRQRLQHYVWCKIFLLGIPKDDRELNYRFKKWLKTLKVESNHRPFSMLHGDYKVLNFNYKEFVETLYGAKRENICYIHGCRRTEKGKRPDEIILGHKPGMEEE